MNYLVHFFLDDHFPRSVVAHGGIFAWPDGRENPDTFQALVEYPKGFLVSYSTSFGNDCDSFSRYMGKKATLVNIGGEGSPRWKIVEEKGTYAFQSDFVKFHLAAYASKPWLAGAAYFTLREFRVAPGWIGGDPWPARPDRFIEWL